MPSRICLVTPHCLASNPRLLKEADALHEAGYTVRVVSCQWDGSTRDRSAATHEGRPWRSDVLDWSREGRPRLYWRSRIRQNVLHRLPRFALRSMGVCRRVVARVVPELIRLAAEEPADLFIGHEVGGLAAAATAAAAQGVPFGFDAEDFHSGMRPWRETPSNMDRAVRRLESGYVPRAAYLTAAAPGIARAYAEHHGVPEPTTVLNVFPRGDSPGRLEELPDEGLSLYWFSQTIGADRGLEDVVRAMGKVDQEDIELHLRGRWQPGYRACLLRLAGDCGLGSGQVVEHDPALPQAMVRLASRHHIGLALDHPVSLNRDICLTNKIFTYLLAGNAVVATATRGQSDLMCYIPEAGVTYAPGDVDALAAALDRWRQDRSALAASRRASLEAGLTRYNWDEEKRSFLGVVEKALVSGSTRETLLPSPTH